MNYIINEDKTVTIDNITLDIDSWRSAVIIFLEIADTQDFENCFSIFEAVGKYKNDSEMQFNLQGKKFLIPTMVLYNLIYENGSGIDDPDCLLNKIYFEVKDAT